MIELADFVCRRTKISVFVLGITDWDENRARASVSNEILQARAASFTELSQESSGNIAASEALFQVDAT